MPRCHQRDLRQEKDDQRSHQERKVGEFPLLSTCATRVRLKRRRNGKQPDQDYARDNRQLQPETLVHDPDSEGLSYRRPNPERPICNRLFRAFRHCSLLLAFSRGEIITTMAGMTTIFTLLSRYSAASPLTCLPTLQPCCARFFSANSIGSSSSAVASVSFQRLRKPNMEITATISTIWYSV